jgi:hypothetical protein
MPAAAPTNHLFFGDRLWSAKDVAALLKVKQAIYRKGRGRKKKGGNR